MTAKPSHARRWPTRDSGPNSPVAPGDVARRRPGPGHPNGKPLATAAPTILLRKPDRAPSRLRPIPPDARFLEPDEGLLAPRAIPSALKRTVDLVGGGALLILLGPVMLLIALLIKTTSHGPALFRQERVGLDGERFEIFKFRTMYQDAEDRRSSLVDDNEQEGPVFKIRNDPRITRLGYYLRRLSLDELPQLFNVMGGQMSLVGPRPPLPEEVETYNAWELQRLLAKPGLTCIWQVSGRNELDFETWVAMDIDYIGDWSLLEDLQLLLSTVPAVLRRDGAY